MAEKLSVCKKKSITGAPSKLNKNSIVTGGIFPKNKRNFMCETMLKSSKKSTSNTMSEKDIAIVDDVQAEGVHDNLNSNKIFMNLVKNLQADLKLAREKAENDIKQLKAEHIMHIEQMELQKNRELERLQMQLNEFIKLVEDKQTEIDQLQKELSKARKPINDFENINYKIRCADGSGDSDKIKMLENYLLENIKICEDLTVE